MELESAVNRTRVLVTNDDGIESFFVQVLVEALAHRFEVLAVVPSGERSWTGRAFTRRGDVAVSRSDRLGVPTWAVDGTPSDCVNIALGNLLDLPPDVVVSGINLGFNVTLPLVLSSGTVAGAAEGALAGIPALALSQHVDSRHFEAVRKTGGRGVPAIEASIRAAAGRAVGFVERLKGTPNATAVVHNVNFPLNTKADTPLERTRLGHLRLGRCFGEARPDVYRFGFPTDTSEVAMPEDSDLRCIQRGHISHTVLPFGAFGHPERPEVESPPRFGG